MCSLSRRLRSLWWLLGYAISRIRSFYMRKIRFTQQTINDKLTQILDGFPRIDSLHPFYSDLRTWCG